VATVRLDGWADVREALRRRELRQALYDAGEVVMSDCLLNLHGVAHRDRRRVENRLFRRDTFEHWEHEVLDSTIEATLAPHRRSGAGDLVTIGYGLAMNLTATIAGLDVDPTDVARTAALYEIVSKLSEGATMAHSTRDPAELIAEVEIALARLDAEFLASAIAARTTDPDRPDVLSILLSNADALGLTAESIRREIGFYLQAGAHSTANCLVHSFNLWWAWSSEQGMDPFRVDMELLQLVVHEGLRLYPASPVAVRRAVADVELAGGVQVAKDDLVELNLMAANRDQSVFGADAGEFNPHRSPPDGVPLWGHSFGGGIHSCIGRELDGGVPCADRLADSGAPLYGTVAVMLAALLHSRFEPDPDNPAEPLATSTRPHHGVYPVRVRPDAT